MRKPRGGSGTNHSRRPVGGDSAAQTSIKKLLHTGAVSLSPLICVVKMEATQDKVQKKSIRLIAAITKDRGMGKDGHMAWSIPSESKYFMDTITRVSKPGKMNLFIWGKLCFRAHPASDFPMANCLHVVLSETLNSVPDHANFLCRDFESAVLLAAKPPLSDLIETIWVIGGRRVYEDAMKHPWCDLIYLTDVMAEFDCDVFFPEFDKDVFKLQESFPDVPSGIQEDNGIKYKCEVFKRETGDAVGAE